MVDETEYDDVMTCDHSYDRRCHTSYTTKSTAQQQEECAENYRNILIHTTLSSVSVPDFFSGSGSNFFF